MYYYMHILFRLSIYDRRFPIAPITWHDIQFGDSMNIETHEFDALQLYSTAVE